MADDEQTAVVIDNGSGMMKAGYAAEDAPQVYFSSVVGRPKYGVMVGSEVKESYIGKDAIAKRGVLNLTYPVANGIVENWDDMTKIWEHTFYNELRCEPTERPAHLTEAPKNPTKNREKMVEIFFDTFQVPAFYVSVQAVLSLYASGRTTGMVYDSGDGVTHTVPVFDGFSLKHAVKRLNLAGRELTTNLGDILNESGINLTSSAEIDIIKDIKEKKCFVALDFDEEMKAFESDKTKETNYELPDGTVINFGNQQIRCPEVLFKPSIIGKDFPGVDKQVYNCIQACDIDVRRDLYENMLLSGGSTMFPGLNDRLVKELKGLANASVNVKCIAPAERKFSVWIGGSTLSTLATFQTMWITKGEYEEVGVNIVHRKCFQ
jgi:actin, other eukaryote